MVMTEKSGEDGKGAARVETRDDRDIHHDDEKTCGRSGPPHHPDDVEAGRVVSSSSSGGGDLKSSATVASDEEDHGSSDGASDADRDDEQQVRRCVSRVSTTFSLGPDNTVQPVSSVVEIPDEFYDRLSPRRKMVIVAMLSFCSFLAPISSTAVLAATPEVAATYNSSGSIINIVNALYMLFMGLSPIVWGPISEVYGRKVVSVTSSVLFFGCSVGTALAPNLAAFFIFRMLTAFEGTVFILIGSACVSDIYRPTERATAMGWFFSGTLIGPAFGPFLGGIIVTYASWRDLFWLQTALTGVAAVASFILLPETIYHKKIDDLVGYNRSRKARVLWSMINPIRVIKLYRYPNLTLTGLASSSLLLNMYSLLTPIRYVLNPRFHLTSPLMGALFYLAPGCGYLAGTFGGGRYADYIVRKWIKKRDGVRVPEDRLRSALPFMGIAIPVCVLIYGWAVEKDVGGIPLVIIVLFLQGVAQLFCFPSLNTYCLDVMPGKGSEVIAGNYFIRYLFACMGTAIVLPAIDGIGVGWFSTICALFVAVGSLATVLTIRRGRAWREAVDRKRRARRLRQKARAREQLHQEFELPSSQVLGQPPPLDAGHGIEAVGDLEDGLGSREKNSRSP